VVSDAKDANYFYIEKLLKERGVIEFAEDGTCRIKVGLLEEWLYSVDFDILKML